MIKNVLLAGALSVLAVSGARAADIEPAYAHDWTGFYVGASFGYAWSDADFGIDPTGSWIEFTPEDIPLIKDATEGSVTADGIMGGIKAGYNHQTGSFVFGLEADISALDNEGNEDGGAITNTSIISFSREAQLSWLATLRARAGIAFDRALVYATGGLAAGDWDVEMSMLSDNGGAGDSSADFSDSGWRFGWVIGGGLEYALDESWSVNVEYLYADFGEADGSSVFPPPSFPDFSHDHEVELTTQVVRAGMSWRF